MNDALERIWRRVVMAVGGGRIRYVNDSGPAQAMQVQLGADETRDNTPRLAEYGLCSVPPAGSDAVVLFVAGDRSNGVVIATGNQTYRLRGLASGEVALHDDKGQSVYLGTSGIRIEGGTLPMQINASAGLTITGPLHVNGPANFTGTVTANGHRIDETHTHGSVRTGTDTSGAVS